MHPLSLPWLILHDKILRRLGPSLIPHLIPPLLLKRSGSEWSGMFVQNLLLPMATLAWHYRSSTN